LRRFYFFGAFAAANRLVCEGESAKVGAFWGCFAQAIEKERTHPKTLYGFIQTTLDESMSLSRTAPTAAVAPAPVTAITQLDKTALCGQLAVSARTLENMVKAGAFPPPVRIGKRVYWTEAAVRKWQQRLFCGQEAWTGGKA
jgi:prophage regulatory protein